DNLFNSKQSVVGRIEKITGKPCPFIKCDLLDEGKLDEVFERNKFDAVIHFAGLKAVGESCENPLLYYYNNVVGTVNLCNAMKKYNVSRIVFSSSACVYGNDARPPISETAVLNPANPYGRTKKVIEEMLRDLTKADENLTVISLRYFNPIGAHESGLIGEEPNNTPNNIAPILLDVLTGRRKEFSIFGGDYDTADGTGVRDYVDVRDLAAGHILSLEKVKRTGFHVYNLGTGKGVSVLELLHSFEAASGRKIPYKITPRRSGDVDTYFADCGKAQAELDFQTKYNIKDMCQSMWKFAEKNLGKEEDADEDF
ncbi:MAG: UDP-glucose 4-epimerase GalE, partial [Christensenellaceae bacterium]|nr:UDP-glucose 4-epimerase GalE [Christensenellaceae bacterium]